MNYGADGNDYFQFTTPSMSFDKASGFTTLITFGIHVNADGTLVIGGSACASNGVYVGPGNWGSLVTTLKTPPTTVKRYEVLIGGWLDTSYDNIKSLVNAQGVGPGSMLYQNFQALKNAVPGIDGINDDDEQTYDLASSTNFANMLGSLGYKFTLVPYTQQNFWVRLKNYITNCDYVYLQCYSGGAGNDPGNWNAAFGGVNGFSLSGFHVIPGQESNTANPTNWTRWYLETGVQGGFYYPDVVFNTTNWSAAILKGVGQLSPITLTNNDSGGGSFNAAGNWSDGRAPVATNAYVDSGFVLGTPSSGQQTFAGGSLLLNNAATLLLNNPGNTTTFGTNSTTGLTVDYNATVVVGGPGGNGTLAGYLNLGPDGGGNFIASNGVLTVSATVGGSGKLNLPAGSGGVVVLAAANNFSGSTVINMGTRLQLQNPQSLSANLLTLNSGGILQLRSDTGATFAGGDNLQGMGHASVTFDVDQLTATGMSQTLGFAGAGFNVGDTTLNFTGNHGYTMALGPLTGVFSGPLTLNATTSVRLSAVQGGANITQLNKNGAGTVMLTGASSYTGDTVVNSGVLEFDAGASGASSQLQVGAGALCRVLTTLPVVAPTAAISVTSGGAIYLTAGENLGVGSLILNGTVQATGSWGSSKSSAAHQNDNYFGGTGALWVGVTPPPPSAPTVVTATPGDTRVTLYWNPAAGATSYNVKRGSTSGSQSRLATTSATSYVDTGLTDGNIYYYAISSTNAGGESANSTPLAVTPGTVVNLTGGDAYGVTSFNSGANWSDGLSPSSGKNYLDSSSTLRTPTSGSVSFAGNSLQLSNNANLGFKASTGSTITVGGSPVSALFLDNGSVSIFDGGRTESLAGYVTLNPGGGSFSPNTGTLPVLAQIGGVGALKITGNASPPAAQNGTVILSANNTYLGGTIVDTADILRLSGAGTLGAASGALMFSDSSNIGSTETLDLNGTSQSVGNLSGIGTARIVNNSASTTSTLTVGNADNGGGTFSGVITNGIGTVALTKVGAGIITLTGSNTYSGATSIKGGTLALAGGGSINLSKFITLAQGAVLDVSARNDNTMTIYGGTLLKGGGMINGNLKVLAGTVVNPGDAIGTLTVQSNINLGGSLVMELNRTTAPASDQLASTAGNIAAGGALIITNTGAALQPGDKFQLFNQPVAGFLSTSLPAGYVWANNLSVDGTIQVNSVISTSPATMGIQVAGNNLLLQWPVDHTGWRLQMSTNLPAQNWTDVGNSTGTNQVSISISFDFGSQFYRLVYP
ncbi:MAG: autotransporter-associated beta strand repeat-containing protein [Verrucomicrobiae bacterium]|nr:autotransporter-associated beta strand repeat-containing protein [Verrucomicrobiae bacterium]